MTTNPRASFRCGVLTLSDKGARGERDDTSGPELQTMLRAAGFSLAEYRIIADEQRLIEDTLTEWADSLQLDLIVTTGGTGVSPRDRTPEATRNVIDREVPGLAEAMRLASLAVTPQAVWSRAMAGMRIGFAIANEKLIGYLKDVKFSYNSYTMNLPAIELGVEAVKDREYFENTVRKIIETREWTKAQLKNLGFTFTDSKSNFLFAAHEKVPAQQIFDELRKRKIYVRHWNKPRIENYLRITIGTPEQMEKLCEALEEILG